MSEPVYVYVVMRGEPNEGGDVIGVFSDRRKANRCKAVSVAKDNWFWHSVERWEVR
jgi:hypothetical protein